MTPYLFWELMILITGVWLIAILFFIYGWVLIKKQKQMLHDFYQFLASQSPLQETPAFQYNEQTIPESDREPEIEQEPIHIEISKEEPISKYENMNPQNPVDISFIDEEK